MGWPITRPFCAGASLCLEGLLLQNVVLPAPESLWAFVPMSFHLAGNSSLWLKDTTLTVDCNSLEHYVDTLHAGLWLNVVATTVRAPCHSAYCT